MVGGRAGERKAYLRGCEYDSCRTNKPLRELSGLRTEQLYPVELFRSSRSQPPPALTKLKRNVSTASHELDQNSTPKRCIIIVYLSHEHLNGVPLSSYLGATVLTFESDLLVLAV